MTTETTELETPAHLGASGRQLWDYVTDKYELASHELLILQLAADHFDLYEQARSQREREGLTLQGRTGSKANPCVSIELKAARMLAALIKKLKLPDDDTGIKQSLGRPPNSTKYATAWKTPNGKTKKARSQ